MKLKSLLALGVIAAISSLGATAAKAISVSYTTSGVFSAPTGTAVIGGGGTTFSNGGITVTFTGVSPAVVTNTPSFIDLGYFTTTGAPGSNTLGASATFVLSVTQTVPLPGGTQAFGSGFISGTIQFSQSDAYVQFNPAGLSVTFPGVPALNTTTYSILSADQAQPGRVILKFPEVVPPANNVSTIAGQVIAPIPVPAAVWTGLTTLAALAGAGLIRRRRMA